MGCSGSKGQDLSNEDVEFLKQHTDYDEKAIRDWYKGFKQDCPDGKLGKEKFVEIYRLFFAAGNPEKFCEHVFRTFDADHNGYIDFKEFLLAVGVTSSGSSRERLKWAFRMYDIDGDGTIDMPEMTKIIKALYEMLGNDMGDFNMDTPEERTRLVFQRMDYNRDGHLSLGEFLDGCLEDPQLARLLTVDPSKQWT